MTKEEIEKRIDELQEERRWEQSIVNTVPTDDKAMAVRDRAAKRIVEIDDELEWQIKERHSE